jgi:hypothetical protein
MYCLAQRDIRRTTGLERLQDLKVLSLLLTSLVYRCRWSPWPGQAGSRSRMLASSSRAYAQQVEIDRLRGCFEASPRRETL